MSYSNLIVLTFDSAKEGEEVMDSLNQLRRQNLLNLDDSALIIKDADGKIHVKNEVDKGIKTGAGVGGLLGLFLGLFFGGPLGWLAIGAIGGALVGKVTDMGVDQKFVKDVKKDLKDDSAAIFVIVRDANPAAAIAALKPYKGTVYQTTLPSEAEEELRHVLSKKI